MYNKAVISTKPLGFKWETRDPFLLCVHHADAYPKGNENMGPAASLAGRNLKQDFKLKDGWQNHRYQRTGTGTRFMGCRPQQ